MQQCAVCGAEVDKVPRYPRYACRTCVGRAVSIDGRPVAFFNLPGTMGLGCLGVYRDDDSPYDDTRCFIDGVECVAGEARFGGIVVQAV